MAERMRGCLWSLCGSRKKVTTRKESKTTRVDRRRWASGWWTKIHSTEIERLRRGHRKEVKTVKFTVFSRHRHETMTIQPQDTPFVGNQINVGEGSVVREGDPKERACAEV